MDHHWEKIGWMVPEISQRPSNYFRRQGWVTFDPDDADVPYVAEEIGADKLLFASDFPHYDAIFPGAVSAVRAQSGISDEVKAMILGGNAARLLRL
jgi:predicted TIM-barrel fold metal-dependent hydrolase